MHEHCEVIIPPTDDIETAIASVMKKFNEQPDDDEEGYAKHGFWDWYVIGGRWAGAKLLSKYDQEHLDAFHKWCSEEKITVSGLQCGKQELNPASQIAKVDEKWNEMFPSGGGVMVACPLFAHSNDQYGRDGRGTIEGDICALPEAINVKCSRVMFAGPSYVHGDEGKWVGPLEAKFMLCDSEWNGVNHMKVDWDGTIKSALEKFQKDLTHYADEYRALIAPQDDWLAVTVDYHS